MARSADAFEEMKTLGVSPSEVKDGSNGVHSIKKGNGKVSVEDEVAAQEEVLAKIADTADRMDDLVSDVRSQMREVDKRLRELDVRLASVDEKDDG